MTSARVHRVIVRGAFAGLTDERRRFLVNEQPHHEVFRAEFTAEGTFTYDARLEFFALRSEVRVGPDASATAAGEVARREAETFLRTMRFGHGALRVEVTDMSTIWQDTDTDTDNNTDTDTGTATWAADSGA